MHSSRRDRTHSGFIGRAPGPLSPPTITQSRPVIHGRKETSPRRGSQERKCVLAGAASNEGKRRFAHSCDSTVVPSQTFAGHSVHSVIRLAFHGRFVSKSQSRLGVCRISFQRRSRDGFKSLRSSK